MRPAASSWYALNGTCATGRRSRAEDEHVIERGETGPGPGAEQLEPRTTRRRPIRAIQVGASDRQGASDSRLINVQRGAWSRSRGTVETQVPSVPSITPIERATLAGLAPRRARLPNRRHFTRGSLDDARRVMLAVMQQHRLVREQRCGGRRERGADPAAVWFRRASSRRCAPRAREWLAAGADRPLLGSSAPQRSPARTLHARSPNPWRT